MLGIVNMLLSVESVEFFVSLLNLIKYALYLESIV
jgi:hypothetical protein